LGSATRRTTDAFGNPANPPGSQGTVQQPFGFTGQPQDGDGLVDLRGRSYVPALGRFLQRDPVAGDATDPLSLNRSTYVRNNPVSLTDPSGFSPAGIDDGTGSGMPGKSRALDDGSGDDQCRSSAGGNLAGYAVNARCLLFLAVGQATLTVRTELGTVTTPISFAAAPPPGGNNGNVQRNKAVGDKFRDDVADFFRKNGYEVATEIVKHTPFGPRRIDVDISLNGRSLGGIETKAGNSRYTPSQRAKDEFLRRVGYIVNLFRGP
jgi:RHS repeat-associated protein